MVEGGIARREFLAALGASALTWSCNREPAGGADAGGWPEKSPALLLHTERPPNLEMPLAHLRYDLTPNDLMFVRWHLAGLPTSIDLRTFRLTLAGHVERPLSLTYEELRNLEPVSVVAVNQCSGNSRALFAPRVPGVQWGGGALGNAKWTGVRLRTLLDRAGVRAGARCVTFRGLDRPPIEGPAPFVKSLELERAHDPDVLVAWGMNDRPLPMLNGFPLRLVVPGWYSTYWVKALTEMTVLDAAFDGGSGIARVEVSVDGGASWRDAALDADLGKCSFRRWRSSWTPTQPGPATIVVRATSASGEQQRPTPRWNRGGYMRNVYERTPVVVS